MGVDAIPTPLPLPPRAAVSTGRYAQTFIECIRMGFVNALAYRLRYSTGIETS